MDGHRIATPRYNLARIFNLRDTLTDQHLTEFGGFTPTGAHFEELVDKICAAIPRVKRQAVWDSIRGVAGTLLTDDAIFRMAWRLSGNVGLLRSGTSVPPWHIQQAREWMPAQIMAYQPGTNKFGRPGGRFSLLVLAGTACPMRLTKFWSNAFARFISNKMGYSAGWGNYPFGHVSELVSLRLWLQIDPEFCGLGEPGFKNAGCMGALKKWNRDIVKKRFRQGWLCPRGFDHYCYQCPVGYDDCPAATHKETIEEEDEADGRQGNACAAG